MKKKFDLLEALWVVFNSEDLQISQKKYDEILVNTGLINYESEFCDLFYQNLSYQQLRYCILGLMQRKKLDSSFIL